LPGAAQSERTIAIAPPASPPASSLPSLSKDDDMQLERTELLATFSAPPVVAAPAPLPFRSVAQPSVLPLPLLPPPAQLPRPAKAGPAKAGGRGWLVLAIVVFAAIALAIAARFAYERMMPG